MTLEEIEKEIRNDPENAAWTSRGVGPIFQIHEKARILIIGQAPGRKVEESGIPFHDQSGKLLMQWLGITEETFYGEQIAIMPMDFYYPGKGKGGDLPPRSFIAPKYHPALLSLMPDIQMTVLLGRYAVNYYLKGRAYSSLADTLLHVQDCMPEYFPLIHPSPLTRKWQKDHPWFAAETIPLLQKTVREIL